MSFPSLEAIQCHATEKQFDYSKIQRDADVICVSLKRLYLLNPFVFVVRSASALQCSRFVYKLWKPHVHMLFEACWLKRLLQHMGRNISSYACQADWILSFFISINNKQRQTPPTDTIRVETRLVGEMGPWWTRELAGPSPSLTGTVLPERLMLSSCTTV